MSKLPRPLRSAGLLAWIEAMDEQFRITRGKGSFGVRFHYPEGGTPRIAKLESPELEFVLDPETS